MKMTMRQGDVGFIQGKIPKAAKKVSVRPLALGEVTGHAHQVVVEDREAVELYELKERQFLRVTGDGSVSIVHEEHGAVVLPKGWEGEITIAREYDEEQDFRVRD